MAKSCFFQRCSDQYTLPTLAYTVTAGQKVATNKTISLTASGGWSNKMKSFRMIMARLRVSKSLAELITWSPYPILSMVIVEASHNASGVGVDTACCAAVFQQEMKMSGGIDEEVAIYHIWSRNTILRISWWYLKVWFAEVVAAAINWVKRN